MKVSNSPKALILGPEDNIPLLVQEHNYTSTDIIICDYKISDHLGKGSYGDVYSAKKISNSKEGVPKVIAIKVIDFSLLKRKCHENS
jgi:serine/threonine protein kinase